MDHWFRYDWLAKKSLRAGYFVWAMTAYGLGMEEKKNCSLWTLNSSRVYYCHCFQVSIAILKPAKHVD